MNRFVTERVGKVLADKVNSTDTEAGGIAVESVVNKAGRVLACDNSDYSDLVVCYAAF